MKTLNFQKNLCLEITDRCYTGCKYCYKRFTISPKGKHVPYEVLEKRILWITAHSNLKGITLLGGEPLLHPDFIPICEMILELGLGLTVITSGHISNLQVEKDNRAYLLYIYRMGKVELNLSYHSGLNDQDYGYFISSLKTSYEDHRRALQSAGKYDPKDFDLYTTMVLPVDVSYGTTVDMLKKLHDLVGWTFTEDTESHLASLYRDSISTRSHSFETQIWSVDSTTGFRVKVKVVVATEFEEKDGRITIDLPEGGLCPAIKSAVTEDVIVLSDMLIRADGGLVFSHSQCVEMTVPLLYVDRYTDYDQFTHDLGRSITQIHQHVFLYNRLKAKDNCDEDGREKDCTSCPFDRMCTPCWTLSRS